ncbi:MAG: hypothetical protein QOG64_2621 [Acidimicrobiaceae bacterium]|nr:hypothetical protein [Acidimicrobiaceae bacterium]
MRKVLLAVGLFSLTALVPAVTPSAGADSPAITFGVPRIVDPIHAYGEPDIKVAPNGDVHVSGPQGTGVQRSIWNASVDGGDSWRVVNGIPATPLTQAQILLNKTTPGPGGGDTELAIAHNGKVFYNDLYTLTCFTAGTSSDRGATVQTNPIGCSTPGADRQWYALFDPQPSDNTVSPYTGPTPLLYMTYTALVSGAQLDRSTDGLNFTSVGTYGTDSGPDAGNTAADGTPVIDQHTGDFLALTRHTPADNTKSGLSLAVGVPDATGNVAIHYNVITDAIDGDPGLLFPVLTQDTARNLYAVWAVDTGGDITKPQAYHVFYSFASAADGWTAWSAPKQVDSPPSLTAGFPWVAAGGPGLVDVVWYGTDQRLDPSDHKNQAWNVYMAQMSNANSANPTISQAAVSPHPMHYDDICLQGTGCITSTGNRNLADFFEVTIDNDGRAKIVYPDTSNGLIQPTFAPLPGFNGTLDHSGAALVTVATQNTGLNGLTGQPLAPKESTAPVSGVSDPAGDALFKPLGGTNVPGADITNVQLSMDSSVLHAQITVAADGLGSAATAASGTAAEAVVRWQMGNTLFYAAAEEPAGGGTPTYYAGPVQSVDLCSVSACDPHYFVYPAPPAGGTAVTGTKAPAAAAAATAAGRAKAAAGGATTYDIAVPLSVIGNATQDSLLEEVSAFVTVSTTPASLPLTNVQADADIVPIQVEGARTFNFRAAALAAPPAAAPAPAPAPAGALPRTGGPEIWAAAGAVMLAVYLGLRRLRRA